MAEPLTCPNCGLLNPPDTRRCDCGYDFVDQRTGGRSGRQVPPASFGFGTVLGCTALGVALGIFTIFAIVAAQPERGKSGLGVIFGIVFGAVVGLLAGAVIGAIIIILRSRRFSR